MAPGTLTKNEFLRKIFISKVQETLQFLSLPENEFIWDNLQFLRYHFCLMIRSLGQELQLNPDLLEKNLRRDLFMLLSRWSRGEDLLKEEQNKRKINAILAQMRDQERESYQKMVNEHTLVLQHTSSLAISSILTGVCWDNSNTDSNSATFQWINSLLQKNEKLRRISRSALLSFFQGNLHNQDFLSVVILQCYSSNIYISKGYFLALVEQFKEKDYQYPVPIMLNLIMYKAGDRNSVIRRNALQLLQLISAQPSKVNFVTDDNEFDDEVKFQHPFAVESMLSDTYLQAQIVLSRKLAEYYPKLCYEVFQDVIFRLEMVDDVSRGQLLNYLVPWIRKMELTDHTIDIQQVVVDNLLLITLKYGDHFQSQIQQIWTTISEKSQNIGSLIKYMLDTGVKKNNPNFIPLSKRIMLFVGRTSAQLTIDALVTELSSLSNMETRDPGSDLSGERTTPRQYLSQFSKLMPNLSGSSWTIARGHLALILLAELSYEIGEEFRPHLPVILHLVFLGFDNPQQIVHEHSRILLLNLVHSLVVNKLRQAQPEQYFAAIQLEDELKAKEGKQLWIYEYPSLERPIISSAKEVNLYVTRVIQSLSQEGLNELWANEALTWAISCPSGHLITRSYQIYRAVNPPIHRDAIIDVLRALCKLIQNPNSDNMGVVLEILSTLKIMVEGIALPKLILFTQFFWAVVALLNTDYDQVYAEATELLAMIIERVDFTDKSIQNVFRGSIPHWYFYPILYVISRDPPFIGVQPLVLKGLLSSITEPGAIRLLALIGSLPCDDIVQPDSARLIGNMFGLLPYLCLHIRDEKSSDHIYYAEMISQVCNLNGCDKIGKVFARYCAGSFENSSAFLRELQKPMRDLISPKHNLYVFTLLFNLLEFGPSIYHQVLLQIVFNVLSTTADVCMENIAFRNKIPQWFSVVAKFIHGPYSADALQVINISMKANDSQFQEPNVSPAFRSATSEFTNKNASGTIAAASAMKLVVETCHYSGEKGSISHDISPTFWNKFFSGDFSTKPQAQSAKFSGDADEELDDEHLLSYLDNLMHNAYVNQPADNKSKESDQKKFKFEAASDFGRFPTFQGFDDILDFGDVESVEEDDDNSSRKGDD